MATPARTTPLPACRDFVGDDHRAVSHPATTPATRNDATGGPRRQATIFAFSGADARSSQAAGEAGSRPGASEPARVRPANCPSTASGAQSTSVAIAHNPMPPKRRVGFDGPTDSGPDGITGRCRRRKGSDMGRRQEYDGDASLPGTASAEFVAGSAPPHHGVRSSTDPSSTTAVWAADWMIQVSVPRA